MSAHLILQCWVMALTSHLMNCIKPIESASHAYSLVNVHLGIEYCLHCQEYSSMKEQQLFYSELDCKVLN